MNLRQGNKHKVEIFTAAMNDIMFFLMLFFIILSTLFNASFVKVDLPNATSTEKGQKQEIVVSINRDRQLFLNDRELDIRVLGEELAEMLRKYENPFVIVRCEETLPVQLLVDVLEIGNQLDVKMHLATEQ